MEGLTIKTPTDIQLQQTRELLQKGRKNFYKGKTFDNKRDGNKRESEDNGQTHELFPEATLDAWAYNAAELKRNKVGNQKIEQTEALLV